MGSPSASLLLNCVIFFPFHLDADGFRVFRFL